MNAISSTFSCMKLVQLKLRRVRIVLKQEAENTRQAKGVGLVGIESQSFFPYKQGSFLVHSKLFIRIV